MPGAASCETSKACKTEHENEEPKEPKEPKERAVFEKRLYEGAGCWREKRHDMYLSFPDFSFLNLSSFSSPAFTTPRSLRVGRRGLLGSARPPSPGLRAAPTSSDDPSAGSRNARTTVPRLRRRVCGPNAPPFLAGNYVSTTFPHVIPVSLNQGEGTHSQAQKHACLFGATFQAKGLELVGECHQPERCASKYGQQGNRKH